MDTQIKRSYTNVINRLSKKINNNMQIFTLGHIKTPDKWKKDAHHYLILHGRYVCKAKNFECLNCCIKNECQFENKTK